MKTGTLASLAACRANMRAVVEHEDEKLDPDKVYKVTMSYPANWQDGEPKPGVEKDLYVFQPTTSYRIVWDIVEKRKESILKTPTFESVTIKTPEESPDFLDFARLTELYYYWATGFNLDGTTNPELSYLHEPLNE